MKDRDSAVAIVFDGDDTLWSTEPLYDAARLSARDQVARAGLDGNEWERLERKIDVENVPRFGFRVERFPTSCVEAYEALSAQNNLPIDSGTRELVRVAAGEVFVADPPLMPGAVQTLKQLRERGFKLALVTKGDPDLQKRRIERSGLSGAFDAFKVVTDKTPKTFLDVVASLGARPDGSWSVGNSVRSDILPAITAGLHAAWIDAHVWEHERSHDNIDEDRVVRLSRLDELPRVISSTSVPARRRRRARRSFLRLAARKRAATRTRTT